MSPDIRKQLLRILHKLAPFFPDKTYVKMQYYLIMGKHIDLSNPKTMNEKLVWLKLHQHDPILTTLVDKIAVKDYIAEKLGKEYACPVYAIWDSVDEIDISSLPNSFVLKTNHSGGNTGVIICKDKNKFDIKEAKKKLKKSLHTSIYTTYREWPYKNVPRRVFAEKYLGDNLTDYKFYCFNGEADCVLLCIDRQLGDPKFYFFNKNWELLRYNKRGKDAPDGFTLPKPQNMDKLFELASELSKGLPFVRMDFFDVDGEIYFGEFTFYPSGGYDPQRLPESDLYFGNKIDLSLAKL